MDTVKWRKTLIGVGCAVITLCGSVSAKAESGRVVWVFNPANSINDARPCLFFIIEPAPGQPWSGWYAMPMDGNSSGLGGSFNAILAERAMDQVLFAYSLNLNNAQPLLNLSFRVGQPIPQCSNFPQAFQLQWKATGQ